MSHPTRLAFHARLAQSPGVILDERQLAARIVGETERGKPADAVSREVFRAQRGLSRNAAREISRAVFAFFRWRGWLNRTSPVEKQLAESEAFAARFAKAPESFTDEDLARAVPEWTRAEMPVTPEWLRSLQSEPRLWLRAKRGQGRALAEALGECRLSANPALADSLEYRGPEDLFRTEEFQAGLFEVQDLTSQMVGLLCAPQPGETWWDACAGEGGKTLHLSDLMTNQGLIWASDRAEWRLRKLKLRAGRAKCFNYRAALWDGGAKLPTKTKFDGVLVDAPCSGIGTWQRNPHARWTTTVKDVSELAEVQLRLLTRAAASVKPGGRLVYAVCTLASAETSGVAAAFTAAQPEFAPEEMRLGDGELFAPASTVTLWPQETGGNGMFVAAWRRRG